VEITLEQLMLGKEKLF
jgi:group I intron endonuclease